MGFSRIAGAVLVALLAVGPPAARPATAAELPVLTVGYSALAHFVIGGAGGPQPMEFRVFAMPDRERREMSFEGGRTTMIFRADLDRAWMIMPQFNMYREITLEGGRPLGWSRDGANREVEATEVGSETLAGIEVTQYRITSRERDGRDGFEGDVWASDDGIVVRWDGVASGGGQQTPTSMELSEIAIGPQDGSLFELPAGMTPMPDIPGMQGMPGMPPGQ